MAKGKNAQKNRKEKIRKNVERKAKREKGEEIQKEYDLALRLFFAEALTPTWISDSLWSGFPNSLT